MKDGKPWVGDEVHDAGTGRNGVLTDVRSGIYVLRPLHGGPEWTSETDAELTVVVPLDEAPPRHSPRRARRRGN
ncbi:hypothetical protein [Streptomyces sp. NPDC056987]|uniref:hypothetical protein n=1 Tax=Streptomyces sp. NPDC056987 TaxID=3345988 RepID=UPI00362632EC